MFKGKFITFYGINNIGKTTHAKMLTENLNEAGFDAVYLKYPIYDLEPSGPYLNKLLRAEKQIISEEELQLWFTLNRYQFEPQLKKMLAEGKTVVAEDYICTGLVWGYVKGAELKWLEEMNKYLLKEDLSIMLEGERALKAREAQHIHETDDKLMHRSYEAHVELAEKYGWERIALEQEKKDTAEKIWKFVQDYFSA